MTMPDRVTTGPTDAVVGGSRRCPACGHQSGGVPAGLVNRLRAMVGLSPQALRCAYEDEGSGDLAGGPACDCRDPFHGS